MVGMEERLVETWLPYLRKKDGASLRLWTFHWAGASAAAYASWEKALPPSVELCAVQLRGRENRTDEYGGRQSITEAAASIANDLAPLFSSLPSAFFGHSSGAWLAYETARALERNGLPAPLVLCVSAFPAPNIVPKERPWKPVASLDDAQFQAELTEWGIPGDFLFDSQIWPKLSGCVREEFQILDSYHHSLEDDGGRVNSRIVLFLSENCSKTGMTKQKAYMAEDWGKLGNGQRLSIDIFPGDHFYIQDRSVAPKVSKVIAGYMEELVDALSLQF